MLDYTKLRKEAKELINNTDISEFDKWVEEKEFMENMSVQKFLDTIDVSKMEKYIDFYSMCESEFEIYEYLEQPADNERLTYCYYYSWICTDTQVGIRVWYFDNQPVCISWKPSRKSSEAFAWLSVECFYQVRNYALSLSDNDRKGSIDVVDDETIVDVLKKLSSIEHKEFEQFNVIKNQR